MAGAPDPSRGVYGITTAADLAGVAVPTLRLYERHGLITPDRTAGGTRRYSDDDLTLLTRIEALVAAGVNLTGVAHVLPLQNTNTTLTHRNTALESENAHLRSERETTMTTRDTTTGDDVTEADRLDQLTPTDPDDATTADGALTVPHPSDRWDADPADVAEQHVPVGLDDDTHPHQLEHDDDDAP